MSIVQIFLIMIGAAVSGALFSLLRFPVAVGIYFLCLGSMIYFAYRVEFVQASRKSSSESADGKFRGVKIKFTYSCFLAVFILIPIVIGLKLF